jgi:nucleoid DNA-binding protein
MAKKSATATKKTTKRTAKKAARSTTASKKVTAKAAPASLKATKAAKPRSKSEVFTLLADHAGISRKDVAAVFNGMSQLISQDLGKAGPGAFNVPGMMKVTVQRKPATKARKGINPFTGEETVFKAKPARNVVKIRPLKSLKDAV